MKDITKNPYGKYNGNEQKYVNMVLDSENLEVRKNPFSKRFEKAFAERFGMKYAIAHNSGTGTLHSCLASLGVGAGDEVISPAQTVIMLSFATLYLNAIPVYADIDSETFNIDPEDIVSKITNKTKAIIVVHMHGLPADMNRIMEIGKNYGIPVIEDSAQCVLGKINSQLAGTFGDMASFSFETKKHLSSGEGGIVITSNKKYAEIIRKVAGLGYQTLTAAGGLSAKLPSEFQNPDYKRHDTLGWNYRMNEVTSAIALAQLERVNQLVERRQKIATYYLDALRGCDWIFPQKTPTGFVNTYWTFAVRYEGEKNKGVSWREFYDRFKKKGGDGFYGGLSVAYLEPVMQNRPFLNGYLLPPGTLFRFPITSPDSSGKFTPLQMIIFHILVWKIGKY